MVPRLMHNYISSMGLPYWLLGLTVCLVLLAWKLSSNERDSIVPVVTFDGSNRLNLTDLHQPTSKEEIVELVRDVKIKQRKLRVLGSGHSLLPLAASEDVTLSMRKFRGLVSVDLQTKQVTVKAGTTLEELNTILDDHGLALGVLPTTRWPTVAGAIMTATHGTGMKYGNLATLVVSLEMVTPNGEIMTISKGDDLFDAVMVSLGLLGVITQVTFQAESAFILKEVTTVTTFQECVDQFDNLMKSHEHTRLWIDLISSSCLVTTADRVSDIPAQNLRDFSWSNFKMYIYEMMQWFMSVFPNTASTIMPSFLGTQLIFSPQTRIEKSYEIFIISSYVSPHTQQEVSVNIKDCQASLKTLHEFVNQNNIPVNAFIEVRNVKPDEFWLSPNYQCDSCHLTQLLYHPTTKTYEQYFFEYFDMIGEFQPRPHWGKHFKLNPNHLATIYPKFKNFLAVKNRLDPSGIMTNTFLGNLFKEVNS